MDYYEQLTYELNNRTQGPDEPLTTYLWNIIEFHQRLETPWSAQDIIRRVAKGLNIDYQTCIRDILRSTTLGELRTAALDAETALQRRRSYKPPSTESLEPACAYRPTQLVTQSHTDIHTAAEYEKNRNVGEAERKRHNSLPQTQGYPPSIIQQRPGTPRGVSFNLDRNQQTDSSESQRSQSPGRTNFHTPPPSPRSTPQNRKANITCHRCKRLGHYANECPDKDNSIPQDPLNRRSPEQRM